MAWEFFEGKRRKGRFEVSLTPSGKLSISTPAYEKWFKGCKGVVLAYDEENRRIGLKPVYESCPHMYSLTPCRRDGKGGYYVAAVAFFKHCGIPLPEQPIRKRAYQEGEMVVIDLD